MAYRDRNPSDGGIRSNSGGQVSSHAMTKPKSDHYLEKGFTKKKAGPAHQLVSACDPRNAHAGDRLGSCEFGQFPLATCMQLTLKLCTWHQKV